MVGQEGRHNLPRRSLAEIGILVLDLLFLLELTELRGMEKKIKEQIL